MLLELLDKLPIVGKIVNVLTVVQKFLDGKKSYIAGSILLLQGLSCLVDQVVSLHGIGELFHFLKGMNGNECLTKIAEGLGIMGIRAGISKSKEP